MEIAQLFVEVPENGVLDISSLFATTDGWTEEYQVKGITEVQTGTMVDDIQGMKNNELITKFSSQIEDIQLAVAAKAPETDVLELDISTIAPTSDWPAIWTQVLEAGAKGYDLLFQPTTVIAELPETPPPSAKWDPIIIAGPNGYEVTFEPKANTVNLEDEKSGAALAEEFLFEVPIRMRPSTFPSLRQWLGAIGTEISEVGEESPQVTTRTRPYPPINPKPVPGLRTLKPRPSSGAVLTKESPSAVLMRPSTFSTLQQMKAAIRTQTTNIGKEIPQLKKHRPYPPRHPKPVPQSKKDAAYLAFREANTLSSRKCRMNKRAANNQLSHRVANLEQENKQLKAEYNAELMEYNRLKVLVEDANKKSQASSMDGFTSH